MKRLIPITFLVLLSFLATGATVCPIFNKNSASASSPTAATFTFKVDTATTIYVEYGTSISYGTSTTPTAYSAGQEASQTVSGLSPATLYHYRVHSTDASNVESISGDEVFTTLSTGPTLSYITARSVTTTGATITWSLSEVATGQVQYGTTTGYGTLSSSYDSFDKNKHSIALTTLAPNTTYHYAVRSVNILGEPTISDDHVFTTKAGAAPPTISNIAVSGVSASGATIAWDLNENATGQVEYGPTNTYGSTSTGHLTVDQNSHSEALTGLTASTVYHYRVISTNGSGITSMSADMVFTTDAPVATGPTISNIAANSITKTSAIISWSLSENATGQVNYGLTTDYGLSSTAETSTNYAAHSQFISGLVSGSVYHYRVRSTNAALNETISDDQTFTTLASGPTISSLVAINITDTAADISWALDVPATGQAEYGLTTSYGSFTTLEPSFNYSAHLQHVSGLTAGTLYHYRVHSTDANSNESISADQTFTTSGTPPSTGGYHAPPPTSSLVINVRNTGATGDGVTLDTAAIQSAINQVNGTGGTVLVPAGTYLITQERTWPYASLRLGSNMTFKMESGAIIKMKPTDLGAYTLLYIAGKTNVNIIGGTLQGERHQHIPTTYDYATDLINGQNPGGEYGYGVWMEEGSRNIYIEGVTGTQMWGDAFVIGGSGGGRSYNVNFYSVYANDNRRQGLSIAEADGVTIRDSTFTNTAGAWPKCGIDIEPMGTAQFVDRVTMTNVTTTNNAGCGIILASNGTNHNINYVTIDGCTITGNRWGLSWLNPGVGSSFANCTITNNSVINIEY